MHTRNLASQSRLLLAQGIDEPHLRKYHSMAGVIDECKYHFLTLIPGGTVLKMSKEDQFPDCWKVSLGTLETLNPF